MDFLVLLLLTAGPTLAAKPAAPAAHAAAPAKHAGRFHLRWPFPSWRPLPMWTKRRPHFLVRDRERFVTAVGHAKGPDEASAREEAAAKARADLQDYLEERLPGKRARLKSSRARVVDSFVGSRGRVYVRIELELP